MTPTGRTLASLRADGWTAAVVESWIPRLNIRRDLFGIIDILAIRQGNAVLAVQATSDSNVSARINKAKAEPRLRTWLSCGQTFEVWGWCKRGGRWECRRVPMHVDDVAGMTAIVPPRRKHKRPDPSLFEMFSTVGGN